MPRKDWGVPQKTTEKVRSENTTPLNSLHPETGGSAFRGLKTILKLNCNICGGESDEGDRLGESEKPDC